MCGVGKLAKTLEEKLLELGGEIRTETTVTAVLADEQIVKDDRGGSYEYKNLIWAADLKALYNVTETDRLP